MYGGNSGFTGMVIYDTKATGDNAVYGYYINEEMHFETGTKEEMSEFRRMRENEICGSDGKKTRKIITRGFAAAVLLVAAGFVFLPLRIGLALCLTAVLGYVPLMIILVANSGSYKDAELRDAFRRFHGCEHGIITSLTGDKECTAETLKSARIYDPECGTAYSGYALLLAIEIGVLIALSAGFLKAVAVIAVTIVAILAMILVPAVNPFVMIQRPVVMQPTEREILLGVEIMKKVKELR